MHEGIALPDLRAHELLLTARRRFVGVVFQGERSAARLAARA